MERKIKLKLPKIDEKIYLITEEIGRKQDGFQPLPSIHISSLSKNEAEQYAEELKQKFLDKWKNSYA